MRREGSSTREGRPRRCDDGLAPVGTTDATASKQNEATAILGNSVVGDLQDRPRVSVIQFLQGPQKAVEEPLTSIRQPRHIFHHHRSRSDFLHQSRHFHDQVVSRIALRGRVRERREPLTRWAARQQIDFTSDERPQMTALDGAHILLDCVHLRVVGFIGGKGVILDFDRRRDAKTRAFEAQRQSSRAGENVNRYRPFGFLASLHCFPSSVCRLHRETTCAFVWS